MQRLVPPRTELHPVKIGGAMPDHHESFTPLDPGRINSMDPIELQYWCKELHCAEADLKTAIKAVGKHVTAVRDRLASGSERSRPSR